MKRLSRIFKQLSCKLDGGAYIMAVVLVVLFSLISISLLLYLQLSQQLHARVNAKSELLWHEEQIIESILQKDSIDGDNEAVHLEYSDLISDDVQVYRRMWGCLELFKVQISNQFDTLRRAFSLGYQDPSERIALYLSDRNKPLSLAGATSIKGPCKLPNAGVKRAYIPGHPYSGFTMIDGEVDNSARIMPTLKELFGTDMRSEEAFLHEPEEYTFSTFDSIQNSFWKPTKVIWIDGDQILRGHFEGNICIKGSGTIEISSGCELKNVIIEAPVIRLKSGFIGDGQFSAEDSLIVESGATLLYPTSLKILRSIPSQPAKILLKEKSKVEGIIILDDPFNNSSESSVIRIEDGAFVRGIVYCNKVSELQGEVEGSYYSRQFRLSTPVSQFDDHLLNARIDATALPTEYVAMVRTSNQCTKRIVEWLD